MFWMALASVLSYGVAAPNHPGNQEILRIAGGEVTDIAQYPFQAAIIYGYYLYLECSGTILNTRSILTAAHCFGPNPAVPGWAARVGSTYYNYGGLVYYFHEILLHSKFNFNTILQGFNIAICRTKTEITFNNLVQPAKLAGHTYHLKDRQIVWATGWGATWSRGSPTYRLQHVQLQIINWDICKTRYGLALTADMLCSGILDVEGKGQCYKDGGAPLIARFENTLVVVGISSWGSGGCGNPYFPGINTRVSTYNEWIEYNK